MTTALRTVLGAATALAVLLCVQVSTGGPAAAHGRLESSTPAAGAVVDVSPDSITLTFNEPVSVSYARVSVTGPDAATGTWQQGGMTSVGDTATQAIGPLGAAGVYSVAWRVVSVDGHPVSGDFSFTLTTAGTGTANAAEPIGSANASGSGGPVSAAPPTEASRWPLVGGLGAGALALGGVAALVARRPRRGLASVDD